MKKIICLVASIITITITSCANFSRSNYNSGGNSYQDNNNGSTSGNNGTGTSNNGGSSGSGGQATQSTIYITDFSFKSSYLRINVGETFNKFFYTYIPTNATEIPVLQIDDATIIKKNNGFSITALKCGTTKVFVVTKKGLRSEVVVDVVDIKPKKDIFYIENTLDASSVYYLEYRCFVSEMSFKFGSYTGDSAARQSINYSFKVTRQPYSHGLTDSYHSFTIKRTLYDPNNNAIGDGTLKSPAIGSDQSALMNSTLYLEMNQSYSNGNYSILLDGTFRW